MAKAKERVGAVVASMAEAVAIEVFSMMVEHLGRLGLDYFQEGVRKDAIEIQFSTALSQLDRNSGALFGFAVVRDENGREYSYGPIPFGKGSDASDPLVSIGFSNRSISEMGAAIASELKPAVGFEWERMEYFWVHRLPDGRLVVDRVDAQQIQSKAIGTQIRLRSLAIQGSKGTNSAKLTTQARLFDELENRFRGELRQKNREAQLLSLRSRMRDAQSIYFRAVAQREVALSQAEAAKGLINASQALGLVGDFAGFLNASQASAAYHGSAMERSANEYNIHVESYIFQFSESTTILPSILPENPKLDIDLP